MTPDQEITITAAEKTCENPDENGFCVVAKNFCSRVDIFDTAENISVKAAIYLGTSTFKYATDGSFQVDVTTASFDPEAANADATRIETVEAYRCDADGNDATESGNIAVGDTLHICVYSADSDVTVEVTELDLMFEENVLASPIASSIPNFVTAVGTKSVSGKSGNVQVISTLMIPSIYDNAGGKIITANGTASVVYGRRMLKTTSRDLQADEETTKFDVEFQLGETVDPAIAKEGTKIESGASAVEFGMITLIAGGALAFL